MGFIYKVVNDISNKIYIGQTARSISTRWREHLSHSNYSDIYNNHLYSSIKKYGKEHFQIEEIEETENCRLDEREKYWIEYYDSTNPEKGYNLTIGGQGKQNYNIEKIRTLWDDGKSTGEIKAILDCDKSTVREALLDYPGYSAHESLSRRQNIRRGVNQYDLQGNFLKHYNSILEAADYDKIKSSNIGGCCHHKSSQAFGYLWSFDNEPVPEIPKKIVYGKRKIEQYNLQDEFIQKFESAAAAARSTVPDKNVNSASSQIIQVCKGKRKTAYGYKWKYSI